MADDLPVRPGLAIPGRELWFTASRASGPGGQNVNKVSTRVSLHWRPGTSEALDARQRIRIAGALEARIDSEGVLTLHSGEHRSQPRNLEAARTRLAALVREALKERRARIPTKPTSGSRRKRLEGKHLRGTVKKLRSLDPEEE